MYPKDFILRSEQDKTDQILSFLTFETAKSVVTSCYTRLDPIRRGKAKREVELPKSAS